jgi:hypothetical protein
MRGWIIVGAIVVIVILAINGIRNDRVHIVNLKSSGFFGDTVSGKLLTEGSSGYVYLWVEMNGKMMCPKKTYIRSREEMNFSFYCPQMEGNGRFKVLSNRNPESWVENNATSL